MALVRSFTRKHMDRNSLHEEIEASYTTFERDGDTYGRETREIPGKKSQTIQLDREGATALFNILKREFNL